MNWDWLDSGYGFALGCAVVLAVIVAASFGIAKVANETGCNQTGAEYGLEADYRFMAGTCFVELPDGRKVNATNLQAIEAGR